MKRDMSPWDMLLFMRKIWFDLNFFLNFFINFDGEQKIEPSPVRP